MAELTTNSLKLSLDKKEGQNGDKLHLTINAKASDSLGAEIVVVGSKLGTQGSFYPFFVCN